MVKGTSDGFVVAGQDATGHIVAYTSTGDGAAWRPTGSLGLAASKSVTSVTLAPAAPWSRSAPRSTAASPGGTMVAVGSADGYPAVWQSAPGGGWRMASTLSVVSAYPGLTALTGVTHGPFGWLAAGVPGPVVLTSADGETWRRAGGGIEKDLGDVSSLAVVTQPDLLDQSPGYERDDRLDPGPRGGGRSARVRLGRFARQPSRGVDHE